MKGKSALAEFCRDLCEDARNGRIDPVRRELRTCMLARGHIRRRSSSRPRAGCRGAAHAGECCPCGHVLARRWLRFASGLTRSVCLPAARVCCTAALPSRRMTATAQRGLTRAPQVTGRDKEVARVIQILARRSKNNPILLGEPGVGKTAIAEGAPRARVHRQFSACAGSRAGRRCALASLSQAQTSGRAPPPSTQSPLPGMGQVSAGVLSGRRC